MINIKDFKEAGFTVNLGLENVEFFYEDCDFSLSSDLEDIKNGNFMYSKSERKLDNLKVCVYLKKDNFTDKFSLDGFKELAKKSISVKDFIEKLQKEEEL